MYAATASRTYADQAAETASPAQLVLMLFDGALASITRAEQALRADDAAQRIESINTDLQRAQRIVTELLVTLDVERGGQVAKNLAALYDYCLERLVTANVHKDADVLAEARPVVLGLRDAWSEACCNTPVAVAG